jgi:hypothetical protein
MSWSLSAVQRLGVPFSAREASICDRNEYTIYDLSEKYDTCFCIQVRCAATRVQSGPICLLTVGITESIEDLLLGSIGLFSRQGPKLLYNVLSRRRQFCLEQNINTNRSHAPVQNHSPGISRAIWAHFALYTEYNSRSLLSSSAVQAVFFTDGDKE